MCYRNVVNEFQLVCTWIFYKLILHFEWIWFLSLFIFFNVMQDEQHHDIELDPEFQGILDLINNISEDELDKQMQTWDDILAP